MRSGSRYAPLVERLRQSGETEVTLRFGEIETLLGGFLPASARKSRAWWSNRSKGAVQAAAWMEAGYHVVGVDLPGERVTFRKPALSYRVERATGAEQWDGHLIQALRRHMGLTQAQFADLLGMRQQTVSEWETRVYEPTRATSKHLSRIAEEAGFWLGEEG